MISIIVAVSTNGVIGKNGSLPWHIPEDLKYFKKMTLHHPIVMGRKTFESIGRPLPERDNYVITRQNLQINGIKIVEDIQFLQEIADDEKEWFVIGGAEIFHYALPLATNLYITRIYHHIDGDCFFPEIDLSWELRSKDDRYDSYYSYSFCIYERKV